MVMPRYQRAGVRIAGLPQISTAGLQEAARTSETLSRNLDRVSNFAFRQAEVQAREEGREYGALNAPTQQQLQDAIRAGEDPSELVPGDQRTVFGRAARGTALEAMALQFETQAREEIVNLQTQFENEQIGLDELGTNFDALVSQQTELLNRVSPLAAQKFSASVGTITNSAYLSAAKQQVQRDKNDYEIQLASSIDSVIRGAEYIVRAGPTVSENGEVVTVDQKVNALRDEIALAAQELDDVDFYNSKIAELDEAVTNAKIGVVMDEALLRPAVAMRAFYGDANFEDPEVQATFESMTNEERRELFDQVNTALADADARERRRQDQVERAAKRRSSELQAQFTSAMLNNDDAAAEEVLGQLRNIDPDAWSTKSEVFASAPGRDDQETIIGLRRLSLNQQLTQQAVDNAFISGNLTMSSYKTFMSDLEQQRNQQYNRAIEWLKSNRGVPEATLFGYGPVQRAADREVAQIKSALLDALIEDPSVNPYEFVKSEVARIEEENGPIANVALRRQAESVAEELRVKMPGASAQELLERLQTDPDFYPNEQRRRNAIENLLPVLIQIEEQQ